MGFKDIALSIAEKFGVDTGAVEDLLDDASEVVGDVTDTQL